MTNIVVLALNDAGLKTSLYYSVQKDELYCLVGASEHRLELEADRVYHDLPLDAAELVKIGMAKKAKLFLVICIYIIIVITTCDRF